MKPTSFIPPATALATLLALSLPVSAATPSNDELMKKIEELTKTVTDLKAKVQANAATAKAAGTAKPDTKAVGKTAAKAKPASTEEAVAKAAQKAPDDGMPEKKNASKALAITLKDLKSNGASLKDIASAFDVPDSPAAAVVGVPQDKVQHLRTPREVGAAAISGVDERGHFQSGLSVDFAPAQWLWKDEKIGKFRYGGKDDPDSKVAIWFRRVLVRTQISLATTKGAKEGDKSSKIALGLHSVLANSDDALSGAYPVKYDTGNDDEHLVTGVDDYPIDREGRTLNYYVRPHKIAGDGDKAYDGEGWFSNTVNFVYDHVSWAVGAAPLWISQEGGDNYEYSGTTAWSSFALTPSASIPAQLVLDVIYKNGQVIGAEDAIGGKAALTAQYGTTVPKTIKEDSLSITGGVRVGTRDFNGTLTAAYLRLDQGALGTDQAFRYSLALEKRVSDNSWLTLSFSKDDGHKDGKNDAMVLGGVKIGLGPREMGHEGQKAKTIAKQ